MQSQTTNNNRVRNQRSRRRLRPGEIIAAVVLLTLLCFLAYILISGLIASVQPKSADAAGAGSQENVNPTPTPFQPDQGGAVVNPDPGTEMVDPTVDETTLSLQKPEGQVNILLLGSDVRPDDGSFRTDVTLWVSLNPQDGFVSIISFPRDLYVNVPGWGYQRINTAFQYGGFELLADTFETNFGVRPDNYVMVDFNGFKAVINNLGGIDVQTAQNLSDTCGTWINPSGYCSVGPGLVHMNGEVALWYARSRHSTNDIDRTRRAQEVIEAIFDRLMSLDVILKAPDLYNAYITYVQTDVSLGEVLNLLPFASAISNNRDIRNYVIGYDYSYDWYTAGGAQVLMPDIDAIQNLMIEALTLR
jgi:LCP family protein required for cell wall assembly